MLQVVGLLIVSFILAACAPATTSALSTADSVLPTPQSIQPPALPAASGSNGVHPALADLEAGVDAIFRLAPAGQWNEVAAQVTRMTATWYARGGEISSAGAPQAALNSLDAALADLAAKSAAHDAPGTLQAANLVSAAIADLYDVYTPSPTSDLRRLAMLERQVWLDADRGDPQVMLGDFAQLKSIWRRTASRIRQEGGGAFADQFDASLAMQTKLVETHDTAAVKQELMRGWQLVALLR